MLAQWLKQNLHWVRLTLFVSASLPLAGLLLRYGTDQLGPNPLATLIHSTGRSALVLLCVCLSITPLRRGLSSAAVLAHSSYGKRLADWNWLIRLRRPLGLWCFVYALAHAWIYAVLDLNCDWASAWADLQEKPYLVAGLIALAQLFPLAATSTQAMMRRLGRRWRQLHWLTYGVALSALVHFWCLTKPGLWRPWPETVALSLLLGYRLALRTGLLARWDGFDGSESRERTAQARAGIKSKQ